jgi:hypothetical protein
MLSFANPQSQQSLRHPIDFAIELGVSAAIVELAEDQGRSIGVPPRRLAQSLTNRDSIDPGRRSLCHDGLRNTN